MSLDEKIAAMPGRKITQAYIDSRIAAVDYTRHGGTVTICHITLDSGWSVRGESACVDPINFDAGIGQEIAYKQAVDKLWPLFGFVLCEDIHRERVTK